VGAWVITHTMVWGSVGHHEPRSHVCMRIHHERVSLRIHSGGKSCSSPRRAQVLNTPPARLATCCGSNSGPTRAVAASSATRAPPSGARPSVAYAHIVLATAAESMAGPTRVAAASSKGPADIARRGIGCHRAQEIKVQNALNDMASFICQALPPKPSEPAPPASAAASRTLA